MSKKTGYIFFNKDKWFLSALIIKYFIFVMIIDSVTIEEVEANKV